MTRRTLLGALASLVTILVAPAAAHAQLDVTSIARYHAIAYAQLAQYESRYDTGPDCSGNTGRYPDIGCEWPDGLYRIPRIVAFSDGSVIARAYTDFKRRGNRTRCRYEVRITPTSDTSYTALRYAPVCTPLGASGRRALVSHGLGRSGTELDEQGVLA